MLTLKKARKTCSHLNPDKTFKGGFEGCVEHFMECKGLKEPNARRMCAFIGRRAGKIPGGKSLSARLEFQALLKARRDQSREEMRKSVTFEISGKRVKEAVEAKVMALAAEVKALVADLPDDQKRYVLKPQAQFALEDATAAEASVVGNQVDSTTRELRWRVQEKVREGARLERLLRNINPKKSFKLDDYELERYGL